MAQTGIPERGEIIRDVSDGVRRADFPVLGCGRLGVRVGEEAICSDKVRYQDGRMSQLETGWVRVAHTIFPSLPTARSLIALEQPLTSFHAVSAQQLLARIGSLRAFLRS